MEFDEALRQRHSVRAYRDQVVSVDDLKDIVAKAQLSPSWADSQPWKVYIAIGQTASKLAQQQAQQEDQGITSHPDIAVRHRNDWAPLPRRHMAHNTKLMAAWAVDHNADFEKSQHVLYHAPAIAYLTIAKDSPDWSQFDLGMFAETLMLAAADKGIASLPSYSLIKYPELARQALDIPEDELLYLGIALGYEADSALNDYRAWRDDLDDILAIKD